MKTANKHIDLFEKYMRSEKQVRILPTVKRHWVEDSEHTLFEKHTEHLKDGRVHAVYTTSYTLMEDRVPLVQRNHRVYMYSECKEYMYVETDKEYFLYKDNILTEQGEVTDANRLVGPWVKKYTTYVDDQGKSVYFGDHTL